MRRPITLFTLGGLLCLASVITFGTAIYNGFNANKQYTDQLWINSEHTTPFITVNTDLYVQVAVKLTITSESINEGIGDADDSVEYNFPFHYQLRDQNGHIVYEEQSNISWNGGAKTLSNEQIENGRGTVNVERGFGKIHISAPGTFQATVKIGEDETYHASATDIQLIIYDNVHKHTPMVVGGILLLFIGGLLLVFSVIFLASQSASKPETEVMLTTEDSELSPKDKNWAMATHLSTFSGYIIPFGGLLAPLAIWLAKRTQAPYIDYHGKEALNFRISLFIYYIISFILCFIFVGFILLIVLGLMDIILTIIAAVKASEGERYRYPLSIRLIK